MLMIRDISVTTKTVLLMGYAYGTSALCMCVSVFAVVALQ